MNAVKYLCDPQIIPAVVPKNLGDLEARAGLFSEFALWTQIDIDDGDFTKDNNWPIEGLSGKGFPQKPSFEVHLMVADAAKIGLEVLAAGAKRIIAHVESFQDEQEIAVAIRAWRSAGAEEVGIALLLETPLARADGLTDFVDFVQLMSIAKIGHQGERFDEQALQRVEELHANYPDMMVAVDGGISLANVEALVRAGANRLVVGSALFENGDPASAYADIHARAMEGCAPLQKIPQEAI